ncbi:MAG: glycosyltransferase family 39 protein [bacterium]|nr:glycosyltransferase family 39 protein [bacterium]
MNQFKNYLAHNSLLLKSILASSVVGIVFVFDHIDKMAFWIDEAATANIISNTFSDLFQKAIIDSHPLFYIYLLKIWSLVWSDSILGLRLFSSFWALAFIIVIGFIGNNLFNRKIGILASFIASTNYFLIWYANQNRPYTLSAFLSIVSFFLFIKLITRADKKIIIGYIICTVFGFYTHPWFAFILASQVLTGLYVFIENRRINWRLFIPQVIIILLAIPSVLISLQQKTLGVNEWINRVPAIQYFEMFKYLSFGSTLAYILIFFIAIIFILFKYKETAHEKIFDKNNAYLLGYLLIPPILAYWVSVLSPIYSPGRYEIVILPALILLMAKIWSEFDYKILCFVVIILFGLTTKQVIAEREQLDSYKSNDKIIVQQILAQAKDGDVIIATDLSWSTIYYYFNHSGGAEKKIKLIAFPKETENHPGWKNIGKMTQEMSKYEQEANQLIGQLKETGDSKIFIAYQEDNPINQMFYSKITKSYKLIGQIDPELPRENSWFSNILIFSP